MYVKRNISVGVIARYAWPLLLFPALWASLIVSTHYFLDYKWLEVPFQPISVIGIAVSFFIGFKNNQSYDRFWEARKIWGGIVNYSRTWSNQVLSLINDGSDSQELRAIHKEMIYRHISWLHALRIQLRRQSLFSPKSNSIVEKLVEKHNDNETICEVIKPYLDQEEHKVLLNKKNIATQIIKNQAAQLNEILRQDSLTTGFDNQMLMKCLEEFYNLQGKCERIKNTPFPRQYAYFSKVFCFIFVALLPFGLLHVFNLKIESSGLNSLFIFSLIPVSVLVSWMFLTWESIGDNSEDPFESRINDVPMTALTRTIEIDLKDMLNEENLPLSIKPKDNVLY